MIRGVLFDLGGTLHVSDSPPGRDVWFARRVIERMGDYGIRLDISPEALANQLNVNAEEYKRHSEQDLRELPTATHAIVWAFRKEWFARAKRLRVLATPGAGRELLPTDAELPPGVVRVNGAFHGAIMSETVLAFIFAHARGLYAAARFQRAGDLWPRAALSPFCTRRLK